MGDESIGWIWLPEHQQRREHDRSAALFPEAIINNPIELNYELGHFILGPGASRLMSQRHRSFRLTRLSSPPIRAGNATSPIRISSEATFWYKRVFPVFWFGFLAFLLCMGLGSGISHKKPAMEFVPMIVGFLLIAAVGYGVMKWIVFDLVDEVRDAGSYLIVKNKGKEERIGLKDVRNVNYVGFMNPPRITLLLRQPSEFGTEISFTPPFRFFHWSMPALARDLIERIDATRSQADQAT